MNTHSASNWNDFNDADAQQGAFDLIPKGTIVPLRMTIKPGGHDDPNQGWTGGYATEFYNAWYGHNIYERAVFLNRVTGPYAWGFLIMAGCNACAPQLLWVPRIRRSRLLQRSCGTMKLQTRSAQYDQAYGP